VQQCCSCSSLQLQLQSLILTDPYTRRVFPGRVFPARTLAQLITRRGLNLGAQAARGDATRAIRDNNQHEQTRHQHCYNTTRPVGSDQRPVSGLLVAGRSKNEEIKNEEMAPGADPVRLGHLGRSTSDRMMVGKALALAGLLAAAHCADGTQTKSVESVGTALRQQLEASKCCVCGSPCISTSGCLWQVPANGCACTQFSMHSC
jgi:hypothetical protein